MGKFILEPFAPLIWLVNLVVLVWDSIADNLGLLVSTWWENEAMVRGLNELRKASAASLTHPIIQLSFRVESLQTNRR